MQDNDYLGLEPRFMGASTILEPHAACSSASRSAMRATFLTQMNVIAGAGPRRIISGAEKEYGKYTMSIKMPCNGTILKVVHKYPRNLGMFSFKQNSETTIIYENDETGEIGHIVIPISYCNHKVFGFEYKQNTHITRQLRQGMKIAKDTILADSPNVQEDGDYWYGTELITAFLSVPGIIEDGVVISQSAVEKLKTRGYGSSILEWGGNKIPLNIYGNNEEYKYFPDIGERVRKDGILYATREYDPELAICDMSADALQEIDYTFDDITYIQMTSVDSEHMPIVEDINVLHTHNPDLWKTPPLIERQIKKYHEATKIYNTSIYDKYDELRKVRKQNLRITSAFHANIVRCMSYDNNIQKVQDKLTKSIIRSFRRIKLDDWRVEIKYGWDVIPTLGKKYTDLHGVWKSMYLN